MAEQKIKGIKFPGSDTIYKLDISDEIDKEIITESAEKVPSSKAVKTELNKIDGTIKKAIDEEVKPRLTNLENTRNTDVKNINDAIEFTQNNYLKLAGGTITGNLTVNGTISSQGSKVVTTNDPRLNFHWKQIKKSISGNGTVSGLNGLTTNSIVIVSPGNDSNSIKKWGESSIYCSGQGNGNITISSLYGWSGSININIAYSF